MIKGLVLLILAAVSFFLYTNYDKKKDVVDESIVSFSSDAQNLKVEEAQKATITQKEKKSDENKTIIRKEEIVKTEVSKEEVKKEGVKKTDPTKKLDSLHSYSADKKITQKREPTPKNAIVITLPKVPKVEAVVPKVITVGGSEIKPRHIGRDKYSRAIATPVSAPPKKVIKALIKQAQQHHNDILTPKKEKELKVVEEKITNSHAGESVHGRLSTYLRAPLIEKDDVIKRLENAGFKVISTLNVDDNPNLISIVFTSEKLEKYANKKDRAYISTLRVLVDKDHKQISISNPLYFAKAFMQDDYTNDVPNEILLKLQTTFKGLKNSKDKLKDTLLPKYHFMMGMPYFEDMKDLAKAKSSQILLKKIQSYKNGSRVKYVQKLSENRVVVGVVFSKATNDFIKKIGTQNALLMPYPIILENGVAKMLNPKYYLAISYPMLKMSQFMSIATVPDAMIDECEVMFK